MVYIGYKEGILEGDAVKRACRNNVNPKSVEERGDR